MRSDSFGYYAYTDSQSEKNAESNRESDKMPLVLNCSGFFTTGHPFCTDKPQGRVDYYLMYLVSGSLCIPHGESHVEIGAGSLVLFEPNRRYCYSYRGGETLSYFWAHFTGSEVASRLSEYSLELFPTVHATEPHNHLSQRFSSIFDAFSKHDQLLERELSALLERLLITSSRSISRKGDKQITLIRALRHIASNYSKEIRIGELAKAEHLSVSRFNYLFKEQMGVPPTRYILALRMSSAKELLSSTDLPIKQIGIMCGYDDPQFFSKAFKAYVGVGPTEYRRGGQG